MSVRAPRRSESPLVILGPTASGKSNLALAVARRLRDVELVGAELVSVDSMQVYRGMDIGTATPTPEERSEFPHHLVDLVEPTEEFTVGAFQDAARSTLAEIRGRAAVPLLVGGTGLYVRSIVDELDIPGRYPQIRAELEADPDTAGLYRQLVASDPVAAGRMEPSNRRRIVRALEVIRGAGQPFSSFGPGLDDYPDTAFVQIGLRWDRASLDERIEARYRRQLEAGFLEEVAALASVELSRTAAQALGYKELLGHVRGEMSLDEAVDVAISRTRRFARRQERWFRRDPRVRWIDAPPSVDEVIAVWDARIDSRAG